MQWSFIRIVFFLTLFSLLFGSADAARANYGYVMLSVPTVAAGTMADLGTVLLSTTAGAVYEGDSVSLRLPTGFSFNWGSDGLDADPVTEEARKSDYLLVVPEMVEGEPNGFYGQEWRVRRLDDNELMLTLAAVNDPERLRTNDGRLYFFLREIVVPSDHVGDIILTAV